MPRSYKKRKLENIPDIEAGAETQSDDFAKREARRKADIEALKKEAEEEGTDPLQSYGLDKYKPFRLKVQRLWVAFKLTVSEISALLGVDESDVENVTAELKEEWSRMGQELSEEERKEVLGRTLMELEDLKRQLEEQYAARPDAQILKTKGWVMERMMDLRAANQPVAAIEEEELFQNELEREIAHLSEEQLASLRVQLGVP